VTRVEELQDRVAAPVALAVMQGDLRYGSSAICFGTRAGARSAYALPAQTAKAPRLDLRASIDPPAAGWVVDLILRILLSQPAHVCPCRRQLVRVCVRVPSAHAFPEAWGGGFLVSFGARESNRRTRCGVWPCF